LEKEYFTVYDEAQGEFIERKSRFIGYIKPITSEAEAVSFINSLKSRNWDATHNCYAYYLKNNNTEIQRYSDDGEPQGTAGLPILEVIKKQGLQDVVIVVTRYFGGILLGASGLIRAYGNGAVVAIEAAGKIHKILSRQVAVTVDYTDFGRVQNTLLAHSYIIEEVVYTQDVEVRVLVPLDGVLKLSELMTETTNGGCLIEERDEKYMVLDTNGKLIK